MLLKWLTIKMLQNYLVFAQRAHHEQRPNFHGVKKTKAN